MLKWTKRIPTKEGYYWYKDEMQDADIVLVHFVIGELCAENAGIFFHLTNTTPKAKWAGPIPEPKE